MKKYRLSILLLLGMAASALLFHACQKEHTAPVTEDNFTDVPYDGDGEITFRSTGFDYTECPMLKSTVYKSGDMLVFQNKDHFEKCAICLEKEYNDYNDQYEALYPNATPEELDSLDEVNSFNEWAPYAAFETLHGFSSYRAKVENDIQTWLDSTPAELFSTYGDPDNTSPVMNESERTLLNEYGFAKAGGDTLSLDDWTEKIVDDCAFLYKKEYQFDHNDDPLLVDRRLHVSIKIKSGLLNSNLIGSIKNYRKINGKYKPRRARLKIGVTGTSYDGDCVEMPQSWSKYDGYKDTKKVKVNAYIWLLWREALIDNRDPSWPANACVAHGYWDNDNKYYPLGLFK